MACNAHGKNGYTEFKVVEPVTGKQWIEYPREYLCLAQEKQMSFQPDMIIQYAHFLKAKYEEKGFLNLEIYVDNYVSLNGRASQHLVPSNINLLTVTDGWVHKEWLVPLKSR